MRCPSCNSENPETTKFCGSCGRPLTKRCGKCGTENPPQFKFCGECGSALIDAAAPGVVADTAKRDGASDGVPEVPNRREGERRHLTVLFCDLVGSTEIAAQLDPEEWRETVAGYHRAAAEAITRFGGHVAKYLGDGVMAFFGYPEAHDNDAERAARSGLAILDAIAKLNEQRGTGFSLSHPMKLAARVGIDSGAVVVGVGAGKEADVFGDAPNIASRVQGAASAGAVLITGATHRLISGLFVVEGPGAQQLKGVASPVELYQVIRPTGVRGRLAAARALTPFVGRDEELRLLLSRWERAREGDGQVALVVGEAGIGKSRLVAEFHHRIRETPHIWMESAGEQFFENTPFHAYTEMLSQWLDLQGGVTADERLGRLEGAMASAGLEPAEAAPLVADLLQLPTGDRYPPSTLTSEQRRRRLLAALTGWVFGAGRLQPVVMVVEDLHWLDPSTLELQELLADQGTTVPLMLLYTARPEFRPQWPLRSHHTQITLNRLSARNVREMIAQVAASKALTGETVDTVVERTGGVPLFVEELTRALVESGRRELSWRDIPVTLHDSLMARLDRMGAGKEVAQVGAVVGSEFSYELLHAVHPIAEAELQAALHKLTDAALLYVRGIAPDATYLFKHALIRDAAYEALLKSRRKELHRSVALTIEAKFPALKEAHPEVLARHWTEAGENEQAIAEWSRTGKAAEARYAFREASVSYQKAVALLNLLPESGERDLRELELTHSIVRVLIFTRGYSAPETIHAIERGAALAEQSGNFKQLTDLLISRGGMMVVSGALVAASAVADRALELALREGSPMSLGRAYTLQVTTRCFRGDLAGAEQHFTAGLKFFYYPGLRGIPLGSVTAFGNASSTAWTQGRADVARQREVQMMAAANTNPYGIGFSAFFAAELRVRMGEYEQAEALAAQALELSEQQQFALLAAISRCALGNARSRLGRAAEGIELIRQGLAEMLEIGSRLTISTYTAYLAAAQERAGAIADAFATVEQALRVNPEEVFYRPEIFRLRGEIRLELRQTELAEADFREAIALAQSMSAKAWELRAAISLARLLASAGRREEARTMLAEIYNWFTEGFDTVDLKDAKALVDELSG
jgi:class 3 adenylate cyclase/tetratricopeptide (TPR) repeat protein